MTRTEWRFRRSWRHHHVMATERFLIAEDA